jgi:hypothetical protein
VSNLECGNSFRLSGRFAAFEDCLYQARWAMKEHAALLASQGLQVPPPSADPKITTQNVKEAATV